MKTTHNLRNTPWSDRDAVASSPVNRGSDRVCSGRWPRRWLVALGLFGGWMALGLSGCATVPAGTNTPPVSAERPAPVTPATGHVHTVQRGETLYRIATRYGVDWRALAESNGIRAPYTIHPGQRLQIRGGTTMASASAPRAAASAAGTASPTPAGPSRPASGAGATTASGASAAPARSAPAAAPGRWQWPADGEVIRRFANTEGTRRGIGIAGSRGDPVRAAADGEVVYAGSGLVGYGRLLIVKHDDRHLTAYAHNDELLVADGDRVRAGQQIARMGSSGTDRVHLHFEVRVDGQPVDPMRYLPAR